MDSNRIPRAFAALAVVLCATSPWPADADADATPERQIGQASYYADRFAGRTMANGEPMRPQSNNAASRTLPLGTRALVRNLENGRSAHVVIKDRGPYVKGRIIDVSPRTAELLGMVDDGVVRVEVVPLGVAGRDS
jgi:rare lipoprotein A